MIAPEKTAARPEPVEGRELDTGYKLGPNGESK